MRPKTSFAKRPPPFDTTPWVDGMVIVCFHRNVEEVQTEDGVQYLSDDYLLKVPPTPGLEERITQNMELWLERALREDYDRTAADVRARRNLLLARTDKEMCLDRLGLTSPEGSTFTAWIGFLKTIASAVFGPMAKYRQALRDIPQQEGFPYDVTFPEFPGEAEADDGD